MTHEPNLTRFLDAQENDYARALTEIKNGRKQSHWMWYIFPQIAGLGFSETAKFYSIQDVDEANAYLTHPVLGSRLREISKALLTVDGKTAHQILGSPDDVKLSSCMTLFGALTPTDPVFQAVLDKYYAGIPDSRTLAILKNGQ
ncbi:DUF1810 domain-containing protein [Spirosoma sp.]|uniref:DUF1810 domain-containing protein n=1 Tax=Spirosoma sp. TaxID=1899569 RepID=UPI0026368F7C|nr:DUF1810 domain-containing protein [Spirosoma sp.]MCX6218442.1 DUF1810 domain-containing protein [Spirosoma sp.]